VNYERIFEVVGEKGKEFRFFTLLPRRKTTFRVRQSKLKRKERR
jgi:hypothetical protein